MTPLVVGKDARAGAARAGEYALHRPEQTLLYRLVEQYYPAFVEHLAARERRLPAHAVREFEDYLKCGRLEYGVLRVRCADCHAERLVAFSCKRRGFCPSCGARRMAEGAALLVDEVLPREPLRQWVLSVPFALRYLFATAPAVMGQVLGIVTRAIGSYLIKAAGYDHAMAQTGAVTLIQRFGSAPNLNIHFHMLFLDGVYVDAGDGLRFRRVPP
jgi:ribosomal protein S27E